MDLSHIAIQLVVALICATAGNMLFPRQIPGKFFGLLVTGFIGVWLGELAAKYLKTQPEFNYPFLQWEFLGVPLVLSVIGSAIAIGLLTTLIRPGKR